jgi:ethanolamine utilization protein EutN
VILCRVEGTVVATIKHKAFHARTLLVVQPIDEAGQPQGKSFIAVDHAQAGEGDRVLVLREGNGVRQLLKDPMSPIRSLVVGVVDRVDAG